QRVFLTSLPAIDEEGSEPGGIVFDCHGVERFNSQMQQFVEKVRSWKREGYRVIVSTEQPQRILGILKEWDCPAVYLAGHDEVSTAIDGGEPPAGSALAEAMHGTVGVDREGTRYRQDANDVWLTRFGFSGGFRLVDVRIVSITDAELFGQKKKPAVYRRP